MIAAAKNLSLSLGVFLFLFVLSEFIVRAYYYPENLGTVIRFDPVLGWSLKPNTVVRDVNYRHETDYRIRINSMGLRDREIPPTRRDHGRRILIVGDSVTFGTGVDADWRYSDFLRRALEDEHEVLNAGVPGWGNDQELLDFEMRGRLLEPDIVIMTVTMANDVINNMLDHLYLASAPKPRFVLVGDSLQLTNTKFEAPAEPGRSRLRGFFKRSRLLFFVKRRLDRSRYIHMARRSVAPLPGGFSKKSLEENYSHWSVFQKVYGNELEDAWQVTQAIIRRMAMRCETLGAKLVVFGFPGRIEADDAWRRDMIHRSGITAERLDIKRPYDRLAGFCRKHDIAFLYPLQEFKEGLKRRSLYFEHDGHPNRYGHALAARVLAEELKRRYDIQFQFVDAEPGVFDALH